MPKGTKMKKYVGLKPHNQFYHICLPNLPQSEVLSEMLLSFFFTYLLSPPLSVCEKLHKLFSYCFPCKMSFICGLYVNDNLAVLHLSPWLYIVSLDFTNAKSQWGQKSSQLVRKKTWRTSEKKINVLKSKFWIKVCISLNYFFYWFDFRELFHSSKDTTNQNP